MTEAKKKTAPKTKSEKPAAKGKTVRIVQIASSIAREASQRQTLIGLRLNKLHRESILEDTPAVRGMINKVKHLVKVVE